MMELMGMAQVIATIAYGIRGLRRGEMTWGRPGPPKRRNDMGEA